jgi:hypothetical protein
MVSICPINLWEVFSPAFFTSKPLRCYQPNQAFLFSNLLILSVVSSRPPALLKFRVRLGDGLIALMPEYHLW